MQNNNKLIINLCCIFYFIWVIYAIFFDNKRHLLDKIKATLQLDGAWEAFTFMIITIIVTLVIISKWNDEKKQKLKRTLFFGCMAFLIAFLSHVDLFIMPFFITIFIHINFLFD